MYGFNKEDNVHGAYGVNYLFSSSWAIYGGTYAVSFFFFFLVPAAPYMVHMVLVIYLVENFRPISRRSPFISYSHFVSFYQI